MKNSLLIFLFAFIVFQTSAQIRVACVGNSVTYGMGVENREQNCYPAVLQRLLGDDFVVVNFGKSGATLLAKGHNPYIKTQEYKNALEMRPDIVVIHLGINDTDPRNYPNFQEEFQPDYLRLIQDFRDVNSNVRVIIAKMSPITAMHWRFGAGTREWYWQIQAEIENIAKVAKCELIDFQEILYNRPDLIPDAIHPNKEGAQLLAKRVYGAISGYFGGLALSSLYTDNMVFQKSSSTLICGKANSGDRVEVSFYNDTDTINGKAETDKNGNWSMRIPLKNYGDYTLKIASLDTVFVFKNVAVGEVWHLSGQSNMSWAVNQSSNPQSAKSSTNIRLFKCTPTFEISDSLSEAGLERLNQLDFIRSEGWQISTQEVLNTFSAVGYYFAQELAIKIPNVRIGLIQSSLGGAAAECFVDRETMEKNDLLVNMLRNWTKNPMIMQWCRDVAIKSFRGSENPLQRHSFEPTYLYESRIKPLSNYTIKGVLWYQGESNAENIELHEVLFPAVIHSFRKAYNSAELPFYFVQLSSLNRPSWPRFRDSQRRMAEQIDNCEMVVSSDHGHTTDVHPRTKDVIGMRLANVALARNYGFKDVEYASPHAEKMTGNEIVFINVAGGLKTSDGKEIRGFEVAGEDMTFTKVEAKIIKNKIVINHKNPKFVRYGWQAFTDANVVNGVGLPLSTFKICQTEK